MFTVRKEIEIDVEELVERLEGSLRGLDDWADISTDDANYIIDGKPEHFDSLMVEIGKEIINKHTHSREV